MGGITGRCTALTTYIGKMKLDVSKMRYLNKEDFRVLAAVEQLMRNHELVPTAMIGRIANMKASLAKRSINTLHKHKLLYHEQKRYDGYRLTYLGYDFIALHALLKQGQVKAVGNQIGVGKESDVFIVQRGDECEEEEACLKLHRLGRTSFRTVKKNRDYLKNNTRSSGNWMHMSRLAALKEFSFMSALHKVGYPTVKPLRVNRHCVLMELLPAYPLSQINEIEKPHRVFKIIMELIVRLGRLGLVHCDFNEFNLMVNRDDAFTIYVIDFPQMISIDHPRAKEWFDRDIQCLRRFFNRRFHFDAAEWPDFQTDVLDYVQRMDERALLAEQRLAGFNKDVDEEEDGRDAAPNDGDDSFRRLDREVAASGFNAEQEAQLRAQLDIEEEHEDAERTDESTTSNDAVDSGDDRIDLDEGERECRDGGDHNVSATDRFEEEEGESDDEGQSRGDVASTAAKPVEAATINQQEVQDRVRRQLAQHDRKYQRCKTGKARRRKEKSRANANINIKDYM